VVYFLAGKKEEDFMEKAKDELISKLQISLGCALRLNNIGTEEDQPYYFDTIYLDQEDHDAFSGSEHELVEFKLDELTVTSLRALKSLAVDCVNEEVRVGARFERRVITIGEQEWNIVVLNRGLESYLHREVDAGNSSVERKERGS
jgi:hypothetical protein